MDLLFFKNIYSKNGAETSGSLGACSERPECFSFVISPKKAKTLTLDLRKRRDQNVFF